MKKSLWLFCRGWPRGASYRPAFVTLSHCARTFHHKNRPTPPSSSRLENFLAAAAPNTPRTEPALSHAALLDLHFQHALNPTSGYRFYSQSRTLRAMAETKWTGAEV